MMMDYTRELMLGRNPTKWCWWGCALATTVWWAKSERTGKSVVLVNLRWRLGPLLNTWQGVQRVASNRKGRRKEKTKVQAP